jgi:hypothetical protein
MATGRYPVAGAACWFSPGDKRPVVEPMTGFLHRSGRVCHCRSQRGCTSMPFSIWRSTHDPPVEQPIGKPNSMRIGQCWLTFRRLAWPSQLHASMYSAFETAAGFVGSLVRVVNAIHAAPALALDCLGKYDTANSLYGKASGVVEGACGLREERGRQLRWPQLTRRTSEQPPCAADYLVTYDQLAGVSAMRHRRSGR